MYCADLRYIGFILDQPITRFRDERMTPEQSGDTTDAMKHPLFSQEREREKAKKPRRLLSLLLNRKRTKPKETANDPTTRAHANTKRHFNSVVKVLGQIALTCIHAIFIGAFVLLDTLFN